WRNMSSMGAQAPDSRLPPASLSLFDRVGMLAECRLQTFLAKFGKAQPGARRRLRNKTMIGQSRDSVDLQYLGRCGLVNDQVNAGEPAGFEGGTGVAGGFDDLLDLLGGILRIEQVACGGVFIFGFEVEKRSVGLDFDRGKRPVIEQPDGPFPARQRLFQE